MGLKSSLFGKAAGGKSSSKQESGNYAYGDISGAFKPALGYVTSSGDMMSKLLGLSGDATAQKGALENFSNSAGMGFLKDQGMDMITSNQAAKGLLNSGDTLKASQQYGQGLASTYLNQMMQNLLGLGGLGLGAGGVMADAGRWSKGESKSSESKGKNGMLPSLISSVAAIPGISDIRAKSDIVHIGTAKDGLKVYEYTINGVRKTGPMAHEVKELRPWAFIPNFKDGFDGVDYGKLGSLK
jgi:hypothetical protein